MNHQRQQLNPAEQDGPIAGPIASTTPAASAPVNGQSRPLPSGNSGAPCGTTGSAKRSVGQRISASAIDVISSRLSDRDRAILRSVDQHQFLTVHHIAALHFDTIAPAARSRLTRRTLARLRDLRILGTLDRRIGGVRAGSHGLIYHVDVVGDRLRESRHRQGRLRYEPTTRFVSHRLAVADAHVALIRADRDGQLELVDSAVEPATWRRFTGIGAARRTLKPDLYAETATTDDLVRAWFIEIDLGTEHLPTLLTKCREYEAYRHTGIEQDRDGAFPLVVWSLTHPDPATADRRRQALTAAIAADPHLTPALFRVIAPNELVSLIHDGGVR
ncbi:hypothetical protein A5634_19860 [Mycobacterium asiaticum]|uniref:Replication-relaxation n=1 Tax=Mycobacterium asiaticum TaxID=1790 RepID=A0A1A3P3Q6_MYCAS|nr:replication-relaxation family protein [Mycobacterium asiaticum]OBK28893.1 hypothetical protein A5634_19860 [Mycobacterium asiaticum]